MPTITVIDNIMAAGKTSWCIEYINNTPENNYLYITPFLDEVQRIITGVVRPFVEPINKGEGKLDSLNQYLSRQQDIASTHELFKHLDEESKEYIQQGHYTLILDEVLNVLEPILIKRNDLQILQDSGCISIQKDGFVVWNPEKQHYDTRFNEIKLLAEQHSLLCINGCLLLWRYPPEIFTMFEKVYILTYLFPASIMKYYFELCGMNYDVKSVSQGENGYKLVDYYKPDTSQYVELLNIYEGDLNTNFYQKENGLSKTWFTSTASKKDINTIKHNLYNYFRNIRKAKCDTILWTTFKDFKGKLKGKGYTNGFIACNCRSTNDYAEATDLAYCVNIHVHPTVMHFFAQHGIKVDQEAYALSEMIQWIWRSAIRKGEKVNIYIPSIRMRRLLKHWLGLEI